MLNRLPIEINPFRLVEQHRTLSGVIPLKQMPRVAAVALPGSEDFSVELEFMRSVSGLPLVKGNIRGKLLLECQRCMQPVELNIDLPLEVALSAYENDRRAEEQGLETWLVEDEQLLLQESVEDEILLILPIAVKHTECEPIRRLIEALPSDLPATDSEQTDGAVETKRNPFAVLKDWKKTE